MIYIICGLLATLSIAFYRGRVPQKSPLHAISWESPQLERRLSTDRRSIKNFLALAVSFLLLFIPAGFRYGIGTDYWARYAPLFEQIRGGGAAPEQEPGYLALNRLVATITDDYQGIFLATSFLTLALYYRFFLRMSLSPAISVFIFVFGGFYLESFNAVKQALAVAILLNTIEYALRHKYVRFMLLTLLAASFHGSALIWLAALPLLLIRLNRANRVLLIALLVGLVLAAPQLLQTLVEQFAPNYAWYFTSDYGVTRSVHPTAIFTTVAAFVLVLVTTHRLKERDGYTNAVVNLSIVNVVVFLATLVIAYLFSRLNYYFAPIQLIAVPLALSLIRSSFNRRAVTFVVCAAFFTGFIFQTLVWNAHGVLPYEWVFSR